MRFKMCGIILSVFLALGFVFSFSIEMSAHEGDHPDGTDITAEQVASEPGNEENMKKFLDHIVNHSNWIKNRFKADRAELIRQLTIFAKVRREDGGEYRHEDIYNIEIDKNGTVANHAGHASLIGYRFNPDAEGSDIADTLKSLLDSSEIETAECVRYENGERVACAKKVAGTLIGDETYIVGLRHQEDDSAFIPPDCAGLTLETTAEDVYNNPTNANLEAYVKSAIAAYQKDLARIIVEELKNMFGPEPELQDLAQLRDPAKRDELDTSIRAAAYARAFCIARGDFKHKNIYIFLMSSDLENPTVIINGNDLDLNGGNLELNDNQLSGEQNIARLFNNALGGDPAVGGSAYVDYHWDDPLDPDDDVENWFEENLVPGTSPKRSYIEVMDARATVAKAVSDLTDAPEQLVSRLFPSGVPYIIGSGFYGDMTTEDSGDDGCAIAGAGHMSQNNTLLNLFLTASVLFSVVLLRKRA